MIRKISQQTLKLTTHTANLSSISGFSLIEVTLSIGILGMASLLLIALFSPNQHASKQIQLQNAIEEVVNISNTHIEHHMSWDTFAEAIISGSSQAYIWKRSLNDGMPPRPILGGAWGEASVTDLQDDRKSGQLVGIPFQVIIKQSTLNNYEYANIGTQAYIPAELEFYPIPVDKSPLSAELHEQSPVFQYIIVKQRKEAY